MSKAKIKLSPGCIGKDVVVIDGVPVPNIVSGGVSFSVGDLATLALSLCCSDFEIELDGVIRIDHMELPPAVAVALIEWAQAQDLAEYQKMVDPPFDYS